ncbi:MAG: transcription termination/antitermination protein NusA [Deltaproteobacteria bacterium]|nr:transcription termination/antitermination protein NusA [Deltaproteobacteria bacterium]
MDLDLNRIIEQMGKDKGISRDVLIETLEKALVTAARRKYGMEREIEAQFNTESGELELFEFKTVVESPTDDTHIGVDEAKEHDPDVEIDDQIGLKLDTAGFGRIAAQTAKQVIIQEVRGAERQMIYDEYKDRKGEIVHGVVRRIEKGSLIVDLGRAEGIVYRKEQVPREMYRVNERIRAYVLDVLKEARGPQIILSRGCTEFLTKLFEQEVPEIYEGIVRIEAAAREPGARAKIAVASRDSDVDPVGACVGMRGSRVQAVVQELRGEKIDIVPWASDPVRYVVSALAPAQVVRIMVDDHNQSMDVIVPDDQLSLAIGKKGQNVRLAVQLTRWQIDIKSESLMLEVQDELAEALGVVEGLGEHEAKILLDHGVASLDELSSAEDELLTTLPGVSEESATGIRQKASALYTEKLRREREEAERVAAEAAAAAAAPPAAAPADAPATAPAPAATPVEGGKEEPGAGS